MRLLHDPLKISASFDDPDLVSRAGRAGAYPEVKVACLVAGMAAGADSTGDMDLLRHGAMPDLFGGVRAPSTLGSFLRSFTGGNVRQLEQVSRELPPELARRAPLLPGADQLAFAGIDSMQRRACGYKKQGAAFGHTKISGKTVLVRGLNALAATISTPQAGPVIAGTRLRGGSANTARAAAPGRTSRSPPGWTQRSRPRSRRSPTTRGLRSATRGRSGTTSCGPGCRRRDRRGQLHRVRLEEGPGHHRPADRPPGEGPEPQGRPGPGRAPGRD